MQSIRMLGAIAVAAAFVSGAAFAQTRGADPFSGEATLLAPASAPQEAAIAGVAWRCEGEQCKGYAARRSTLDGLVRECKKVAAVIGPVSSYRSRGRELSTSQLRACNAGVIQVRTARN